MLLLEAVLVAVAQLHHRRHVDLVERGQDGGGRLRLHEALGDARAQARHRNALLGAVARREWIPARARACAAGASRLRRARPPATSALVTRPSRPVPGDAPRCRRPSRRRSWPRRATAHSRRGRGRGGRRAGRAAAAAAAFAASAGRRPARRPRRRPSVSITAITSPQVTVLAVGLDDLREHAVDRRRQLQDHLVGLDVDQVLVALHRLAHLLVPGDERGLRDALGELRDLHFDLHVDSFPYRAGEPLQPRPSWRTRRPA